MISTLGGLFNLNHFDQSSRANDVIVIRHKDGSLHSTPFNVRFGRAQMWNYAGRVVQVEVNGELTSAVMKIGKGGETYWLQPTYGVFGHPSCSDRTEKSSTNATGEKDKAAAMADSAEVAPAAAAGNKGSGALSNEKHGATANTSAGDANPSLSLNAVDLRQFSIHPESPLEEPTREPTTTTPSTVSATLNSGGAPAAGAATPTTVTTPRTSDTTATASAHGSSGAQKATQHMSNSAAAAAAAAPASGSPDSTVNLPLLHRGDDGHLIVETRAIHSAGDVQEARLALQAMAAAEKSRRRLSKLLLQEDSYLLHRAEEEGQLGATPTAPSPTTATKTGAGEVTDDGNTPQCVAAAGNLLPATRMWNTDALLEAVEEAKLRQRAAADGEAAQAPSPPVAPADLEPSSRAKGDGEAAVPEPPARAVTADKTASNADAAAAAAAEEVSSVGSGSGSIDSYKVEDTDNYFLDPIDADEYANMYGEDELLKNVSFSSSVTSGVSITDVAMMGGSGSDASKSSLVKNAAGDGGTAAATTNAAATAGGGGANRTAPTTGGRDSPLRSGKPTGKGGATPRVAAAAAASPAPTKTASSSAKDGAAAEVVEDAEGRVVHPSATAAAAGGPYFTRTLIPVEADLWKLHLKDGCNTVRYLARKDKGEIVSISCNIFLWNWTDRLVVSDVDGTITKSDLLGHFYAMLGKGGDWTHPGICNLYTKIARNGYHMVYLTARSVSQINQTKSYLFTLQQDGVGLPLGPVLTAPQRFFTALTQEVSKQSHVFKIACLTSVRAAFPPHTKPFFAGFGNRYNDVISYDAVNIPTHKIFIIDPSSVLHVCLVKQTYRDLGHLVDVTFPPLKRHPVVMRAVRHPRLLPHELEANKYREDGGGGGSARIADTGSRSSQHTRQGAKRHADARDLLHRSSSSSSSMSSCCSDMYSSSCVSDPQELGSASSDGSMEAPPATSASGVAPSASPAAAAGAAYSGDTANLEQQPGHVSHHHHHHHHHRSSDDGEDVPVRHASAAFSLANSSYVPSTAAPSAAVSSSKEGLHKTPASATGAPVKSPAAATRAGGGNVVVVVPPAANVDATPAVATTHPLARSESGASEYSGFSGSASPCMLRAPTSSLDALAHADLPAEGSSTVPFSTLPAVSVVPPPHSTETCAASPSITSRGTGAGGVQPTGATAASSGGALASTGRNVTNGPKYNYGQRGSGSTAAADSVYVADVEDDDEEVPVDPDFSSFAYWRMDPRDLISPPAKAAAKAGATATSYSDSNTDSQSPVTPDNSRQAETRSTPNQTTPHTQRMGRDTEKSNANTPAAVQASTSSPVADISHPHIIQNRGLTSPNSSKDAVAAVKAATVNAGGAVDAHRAGAEAAKAAPTSASAAYTDLATGTAKSQSEMREKVTAAKEAQSTPAASQPEQRSVAEGSSGERAAAAGTAVKVQPTRERPSPTARDNRVAATQSATNGATAGSQKRTSTRRSFFSAFTFGRGQSTTSSPPAAVLESPNSAMMRQAKEEAKKKALAHPDALEYYRLQEQQQEEAPYQEGQTS